jgi:hypothetical protein
MDCGLTGVTLLGSFECGSLFLLVSFSQSGATAGRRLRAWRLQLRIGCVFPRVVCVVVYGNACKCEILSTVRTKLRG